MVRNKPLMYGSMAAKNVWVHKNSEAGIPKNRQKQKHGGRSPHAIPRFSRSTSNYDLHENGRWVAAHDLLCSQRPPHVCAWAGGLQSSREV